MEFVKVHGTGNDFVLLPDLDDELRLTAELTARLCARHTGLGADGVIRLGRARNPDDDVFMDYRNADGSVAEMCGNGVRCVAKYVVDRGLCGGDVVRVDTRAGTREVDVVERWPDGRARLFRVDMGIPEVGKVGWSPNDGSADAADVAPAGVRLTTVSMGNPHVVCVANHVEDVPGWPLEELACRMSVHPEFPDGVNTEVIAIIDRSRLRGRIFERGVGETLASGTGASAMAVAAMTQDLTGPVVEVELPGGVLTVDWTAEHLVVTGPAVEVAHGTLDDAWILSTT